LTAEQESTRCLGSAAGAGQDELGDETGEEANGQTPAHPGRRRQLAAGGQQLDDDEEEAPADRVTGQGRCDAEPFRGVVQTKADDQTQRQRQGAGSRRVADGQALGEIVQPDADGDEQRQPPRRRRARAQTALSLDNQPQESAADAQTQQRQEEPESALVERQGLLHRLGRVLHDIDEEEEQHPDGERVEQGERLPGHDPQARERQAEEDREAGYRSEDDGLGRGHASSFLAKIPTVLVRISVTDRGKSEQGIRAGSVMR